jgi:hypothetical protein
LSSRADGDGSHLASPNKRRTYGQAFVDHKELPNSRLASTALLVLGMINTDHPVSPFAYRPRRIAEASVEGVAAKTLDDLGSTLDDGKAYP